MELDFLDGQLPVETTAPAEQPAELTPEGPARGLDGKFVAQAPEPAPEPAPLAEAPPAPVVPPPEPGHVPLSGLLDEREKRQAAERRLAELERQVQSQREPQQGPDPYEDPAGYTHQVALNIKLDLSEDMARGKHGDAAVDQAREWALQRMAQSPSFRDEVLSNRNPYEHVVQAYQRDQVVSQLTPNDLAAFKAWQIAQATLAPPAALAAAPPPVAAPPRSLASATSAGGAAAVPSGPGAAFDGVFTR